MFVTEGQRKALSNQGHYPPAALDPHKLYAEERAYHRATATGIGKLVFEFIPFSIIKSFALAIDPLKKFRAIPVKITPVNRTRRRERTSILDERKHVRTLTRTHYVSQQIPGEGLFCYHKFVDKNNSGSFKDSLRDLPRQDPMLFTCKDTTVKSRPPESAFGEFENFKYAIYSPPLVYSWSEYLDNQISMPSCAPILDTWVDSWEQSVSGQGAVFDRDAIANVRTDGLNYLANVMQEHALKMLAKTVPENRRYTLFRNVVELRDLPRSILSLKRAVEKFNNSLDLLSPKGRREARRWIHSNSKSIPGEYVSFHFGWRQLYNDVMGLLEAPIRAAKEINRLQRRSGQPTTFRSQEKFPGTSTTSPSFNYDTDTIYGYTTGSLVNIGTTHSRKMTLKMVINATFDFPSVGVPQFKRELFLRKLGVYPMPTDLYNLVPWTWLVDWFTGLGNYVEAIDMINTDRSLINWGLLTGITDGEITTTRNGKYTDRRDVKIDGVRQHYTTERFSAHVSRLEYRLQVRKNITTAYGVKTILEPSSLSPYQMSILGAILASRRR